MPFVPEPADVTRSPVTPPIGPIVPVRPTPAAPGSKTPAPTAVAPPIAPSEMEIAGALSCGFLFENGRDSVADCRQPLGNASFARCPWLYAQWLLVGTNGRRRAKQQRDTDRPDGGHP